MLVVSVALVVTVASVSAVVRVRRERAVAGAAGAGVGADSGFTVRVALVARERRGGATGDSAASESSVMMESLTSLAAVGANTSLAAMESSEKIESSANTGAPGPRRLLRGSTRRMVVVRGGDSCLRAEPEERNERSAELSSAWVAAAAGAAAAVWVRVAGVCDVAVVSRGGLRLTESSNAMRCCAVARRERMRLVAVRARRLEAMGVSAMLEGEYSVEASIPERREGV